MLFRMIYIPFTIVIVSIGMFFSCKLNEQPNMWRWFFLSWFFTCCTPIWTIISKYSDDIVFDAALFDIIIFLTSIFISYYMRRNLENMNLYEVIGIIIMIFGLFIFKLNFLFKNF